MDNQKAVKIFLVATKMTTKRRIRRTHGFCRNWSCSGVRLVARCRPPKLRINIIIPIKYVLVFIVAKKPSIGFIATFTAAAAGGGNAISTDSAYFF